MKRLSPLDATFLYMESKRTPMHVGSMMTFKMPKDAPSTYFQDLLEILRSEPFMPAPFDSRLADTRFSKVRPAWVKAELDMEYHIRHSALPKPGGERELGVLVSRLHSQPLDFDRPLWEVHLIEGLKGRRFAFYFKAHHCAIDGMGAMSMVKKWLKTSADDMTPPGSMTAPAASNSGARKKLGKVALAMVGKATDTAKGTAELGKSMIGMAQGETSMIKASSNTPKTLFNAPVSQQRRLGTQLIELERFKKIAKALNVTVNDVVLGVVGGAVRRYLQEQNALPNKTLTVSVPMGLDRKDGDSNAATGFVCPLVTEIGDPVTRVKKINAATLRAKSDLKSLSRPALENLALSGLMPLMVGQMTGTLSKMSPMFNFVVSNVVLTKHKLYMMGAELEAMYPMSFLFDGYALNVTVIGYGDHVGIGFIGCRDVIPKLQTLAVYAGEAVEELEIAAGVKRKRGKLPNVRRSPRKSPTTRKKATATK